MLRLAIRVVLGLGGGVRGGVREGGWGRGGSELELQHGWLE